MQAIVDVVDPVKRAEDSNIEGDGIAQPASSHKLDLRYFTLPQFCPAMVRQRSRSAFEVFLFLAHRWLHAQGTPVSPTHEDLCRTCGLEPTHTNARAALSRLLARLRKDFGVIDYEPVRRRRPQIRLRPIDATCDPLDPRQYVYLGEPWDGRDRAVFDALGSRAFAAEYTYILATYEAAVARTKHGRAYWFYPLDKFSRTYHVSARFASVGLQALTDLGVMRISHGRRDMVAPAGEYGRANRYYFEGLHAIVEREDRFSELQGRYPSFFKVARRLSVELINGPTVRNIEGLCELFSTYGEAQVREVLARLSRYQKRNPRRHLAYLRAVLAKS
jgi:hypothetical protein